MGKEGVGVRKDPDKIHGQNDIRNLVLILGLVFSVVVIHDPAQPHNCFSLRYSSFSFFPKWQSEI